MKQTIDITQRNLLTRSLAQLAMNLAGGQNLALLGAFLETRQRNLARLPRTDIPNAARPGLAAPDPAGRAGCIG
jgi:hypothetical protein